MRRWVARRAIAVLFLVSIPLGPRPAAAGWVIDEEVKGIDGDGRPPVRQQAMLQANRMKRVMLGADGSPTHAFILNLDAETITTVDYQGRRYMSGTLQEFVQMTTDMMKMAQDALGQMGDVMARMRESMKNMPPEQRQMMEETMRSRMPQAGAAPQECRTPKVEVRRTGQEATIAGYRAAQYEVVADTRPESEVWVARDLTAWRELDPQKLQRFGTEMAKIARCAPGQARAGFGHADQSIELAREGYPVRIVSKSGGTMTSEVVKAATRPLPAAEFEPPAEFTQRGLREMMGR